MIIQLGTRYRDGMSHMNGGLNWRWENTEKNTITQAKTLELFLGVWTQKPRTFNFAEIITNGKSGLVFFCPTDHSRKSMVKFLTSSI